jgi:ubiquitin carboxyl-terminal hydrolase 16
LEIKLQKATPGDAQDSLRDAIEKIQHTIATDPENPPPELTLPDLKSAPKRRIARHIRLTVFPKVMAIHLSRSIFNTSTSQKNSAKVSFQEQMSLGGILDQKRYKLRGVVTHKGSHHSGHYETFRRQNAQTPFSNPNTFQASGFYVKPTSAEVRLSGSKGGSPSVSTPDLLHPELGTDSSLSAASPSTRTADSSVSVLALDDAPSPAKSTNLAPSSSDKGADTVSLRSVSTTPRAALPEVAIEPSPQSGRLSLPGAEKLEGKQSRTNPGTKRRKPHERWWRISDEKIKEASTRDVLGMQREVYLLFYELDGAR